MFYQIWLKYDAQRCIFDEINMQLTEKNYNEGEIASLQVSNS